MIAMMLKLKSMEKIGENTIPAWWIRTRRWSLRKWSMYRLIKMISILQYWCVSQTCCVSAPTGGSNAIQSSFLARSCYVSPPSFVCDRWYTHSNERACQPRCSPASTSPIRHLLRFKPWSLNDSNQFSFSGIYQVKCRRSDAFLPSKRMKLIFQGTTIWLPISYLAILRWFLRTTDNLKRWPAGMGIISAMVTAHGVKIESFNEVHNIRQANNGWANTVTTSVGNQSFIYDCVKWDNEEIDANATLPVRRL